jgi:tRNA (cmo5U34)-methyltransferase
MQDLSLICGAGVKDQITPTEPWKFDEQVTDAFDDMLKRSIPQYDVMRNSCVSLATRYAQDEILIVDLGTSRGEALAQIAARRSKTNRYLGLEISEPMIEAARKRFRHYNEAGFDIVIDKHDLRNGLPDIEACIIFSILTLQFTPIEYRLKIVQDIYKKLTIGGAFIFVEKVLGASADLDKKMILEYYSVKAANGYSEEQIERKRLSLEGVLVPLTASWNESLLHNAGFTEIDCFWRWMNFAGWIAIK